MSGLDLLQRKQMQLLLFFGEVFTRCTWQYFQAFCCLNTVYHATFVTPSNRVPCDIRLVTGYLICVVAIFWRMVAAFVHGGLSATQDDGHLLVTCFFKSIQRFSSTGKEEKLTS